MTYIAATACCSKYRFISRRAVGVELDVEESFFLLPISQVFSIIVLLNMLGSRGTYLVDSWRHYQNSSEHARFFTANSVSMNSDLLWATRETYCEPPLCPYAWKIVRHGHWPCDVEQLDQIAVRSLQSERDGGVVYSQNISVSPDVPMYLSEENACKDYTESIFPLFE